VARDKSRRSATPAKTDGPDRRKLIAFDEATFHALNLLARDSMSTIQELADEAFRDLLEKHNRPTDLKTALRESARSVPANENRGATGRNGGKPKRR
jgi:hypothetical protein